MKITLLLASLLLVVVAPVQAALIDTMDNTNNFSDSFGGTTATANGDGTVSIIRTVANQDAGIVWRPSGTGYLSLTDEFNLTLTPTSDINGGYYSATLLFFDASNNYVSQSAWFSDTNSTAIQNLDVSTWINTPSTATEYYVLLRVQPWGSTDVGFMFTEASAVPEPTSYALLFLSVGALVAGVKFRARKA